MTELMNWRLERFETVASTSDLCKTRAEAGEAAGLAVLARYQTSGRGTRGREWQSLDGNLAISILLRPDAPQRTVPLLPFVIGLSIIEAVTEPVVAGDLQLKWPNDLMLAGGKLGGVLIELGGAAEAPWVVVGIGMNLRTAPEVPGRQVRALADYGVSMEPEAAAWRILGRLENWLAWALEEGGAGRVYRAWQVRAHPVGTRLAVQQGGGYVEGLFSGLDGRGALMLQTDSGEVVHSVAGDVLLLG